MLKKSKQISLSDLFFCYTIGMNKEELMEAIGRFFDQKSSVTIRICGHGASGKSTLAADLAQYLGKEEVNVLAGDLYVIPGQISDQAFLRYEMEGQAVEASITACHPVRHELISLKRDISALSRGMDLLTPDMPWQKEEILKGQKPITIVEGMSPTFLEKDLFDLSIYIYTDAETELARRLVRDVAERGRIPDFVQKNADRRRRQYQLYMEPYKNEFDILINDSQGQFLIEANSFRN